MEFKVGDRVRRVRGNHLGMRVGDCDTVVQVNVDGGWTRLKLREYQTANGRSDGGSHDPENVELVQAASSMLLSTDATERKNTPITTGVLDYFPRALAAVAQCSKAGNDQHNPGKPLHWAKEKSKDHADCIARHLIDRRSNDTDGVPHAAKLAWRALALLEIMLEEQENKNAA